jgi:hypothetical protein
MALQKSKELPSGSSGNYWKIISVSVDRVKLELSAKIALFKDKDSSDQGKKPLGLVHTFSGIQTKEALSGDLTGLAYDMIKTQCSGDQPSALSGKLMAYNDLVGSQDV